MYSVKELEERILKSFKKKLGKEVEGLDIMVAFNYDCWPDDEGFYLAEVMERETNGKVWTCICTRSGNVKDYYEVG
jgi:hypothetical protein